MVILNADHPDIEEFIWCKAIEERKARALRDAGFDMDLDGSDSHSIQYQNANNSVRVTDEFMQAVVDDGDWDLKAVTTGEPIKTVKARDLMRQISQAAWECADPGMQFDTTINRWHTAPNTGRINAQQPVLHRATRSSTPTRAWSGSTSSLDRARARRDVRRLHARRDEPRRAGRAARDHAPRSDHGHRLERDREAAVLERHGAALHAEPPDLHRRTAATSRPTELTDDDEVKVLDAAGARDRAPTGGCRCDADALRARRHGRQEVAARSQLPEKWSPELAHYLGWLVGDGCISGDVVSARSTAATRSRRDVLPDAPGARGVDERRRRVEAVGAGERHACSSARAARVIARFFEALGVSRKKAAEKVVPEADLPGADRDRRRVPAGPVRRRRLRLRRREEPLRRARLGVA